MWFGSFYLTLSPHAMLTQISIRQRVRVKNCCVQDDRFALLGVMCGALRSTVDASMNMTPHSLVHVPVAARVATTAHTPQHAEHTTHVQRYVSFHDRRRARSPIDSSALSRANGDRVTWTSVARSDDHSATDPTRLNTAHMRNTVYPMPNDDARVACSTQQQWVVQTATARLGRQREMRRRHDTRNNAFEHITHVQRCTPDDD
jgi:hypothetical protein